MKIWHNTKLVDQVELPQTSGAWLMGDGAFETIRTYLGRPFALEQHLIRLQNSLEHLQIKAPEMKDVLAGVEEVLAANAPHENGRLRITVYSDGQWLATHFPYEASITPSKLMRYPDIKFSKYAIANVKSASYAENFRAIRLARARGFDDCLFVNEKDEVIESAMANVLWLRDGKWFTPKLSSGALPGVTRALLIQHFGVLESTLQESEMGKAESLALVSSLREIQPVERYESILYPNSKLVTEFQSSFHAWVRDKLGI